MPDMHEPVEMPLTDAALRLRITYAAALRRMLRGDLRGRRVDGRHWYVAVADVERSEARAEGGAETHTA